MSCARDWSKFRPSALALTIVAFAAACGGGAPQPGTPAPQVISTDGSSTVFPVTEAVAEAFQQANPAYRVTVAESGTSAGLQKFCRGEVVLANASRPIRPTETEACAAAGITYVELPVAYDGLSVVVNPKNTWATSITVAELKKLWEPAAQGQVTRWSQIRARWPDQEIHLFGPGTASGTFDYFTEAVNGKAKASRGDYTASEDDNVLVQGVAGDLNGLGYFGLAYYEQNRDKLRVVPVDDGDASNGAGPITPSAETVRNGTYRPLSRPLIIYVSQSALARAEVQKFVEFYINSPADRITAVGYVPLAAAEEDLVKARFAARTAGSAFVGASQTSSLESLLRGQK